MARSKYKRKGKAKFIMIESYVVRSAAWRSLSSHDKALYLEFKWRYDGLNNGRIGLSAREAARAIGTSQMTALRSLRSLESRGFIAMVKRSGFNVKSRVATEWRLTEYSCDVSGHLPTKDFTRWEDEEKSTASPRERTAPPREQFEPRWEAKHA